jgi:DNA-binding MarR family transcriptional regulator
MTTPLEARGHWEHWLVHLLWVASTRTSSLGEAALADEPVTLAGLGMLENVNARPGITISDISRRAPQTQQALSQIAARLETLGFIERRLPGPGRGRGVGLHLTPAGDDARLRAEHAIEAFEAAVAEALGSARHARLVELLEELRPVFDELHDARREKNG